MASERILLAAWTAPGADMPKYVNATLVRDGEDSGVEFTVRSPKDLGSTTSVVRIPLKQSGEFVHNLISELMHNTMAPEEKMILRAWREGASQ